MQKNSLYTAKKVKTYKSIAKVRFCMIWHWQNLSSKLLCLMNCIKAETNTFRTLRPAGLYSLSEILNEILRTIKFTEKHHANCNYTFCRLCQYESYKLKVKNSHNFFERLFIIYFFFLLRGISTKSRQRRTRFSTRERQHCFPADLASYMKFRF